MLDECVHRGRLPAPGRAGEDEQAFTASRLLAQNGQGRFAEAEPLEREIFRPRREQAHHRLLAAHGRIRRKPQAGPAVTRVRSVQMDGAVLGDVRPVGGQLRQDFQTRDDRRGPRFPDMRRPYDRNLIDQALAIARAHNFACHRGVYAAMLGPNYETRAEYRFLRQMGADVVGMSTVPEVIVAVRAGLRVLGLSAVANLCCQDVLNSTDAFQVAAAAESAEPKMSQIVKSIVANLDAL